MCSAHEEDYPRQQPYRHGYQRPIREYLFWSELISTDRQSAAYEAIAKPAWWNKSIDMGPVIEQGTHFCDLSRYFGGDVEIDSVV